MLSRAAFIFIQDEAAFFSWTRSPLTHPTYRNLPIEIYLKLNV